MLKLFSASARTDRSWSYAGRFCGLQSGRLAPLGAYGSALFLVIRVLPKVI
jgi:hypothetical protein